MVGSSEKKKWRFVWYSTNESVSLGIPSALAALEVALAAAIWWGAALAFQTFSHLWVSICVAPFLLLRSPRSVEGGLVWFSGYLDRLRERVLLGPMQCLLSVVLGTFFSFLVSLLLSVELQFPAGANDWLANLLKGAAVGYIAVQASIVGVIGAIILLGRYPSRVGYGALAEMFAAVASVIVASILIANVDRRALLGATVGWTILFTLDTYRGLREFVIAVKKYNLVSTVRDRFRESGVLVRAVRETIDPVLPQMLAELSSNERRNIVQSASSSVRSSLGLSAGVWLRSIAIRLAATVLHLPDGFRRLPENYFQALFAVDLRHRVELVPGCLEPLFTSEGLLTLARESTEVSTKLFYYANFLVLIIPGYVYRIGIKSTFWVYLPLVYVARRANLLSDIESRKEWARRLLAVITLVGFATTNLLLHSRQGWVDLLSVKVVSPIEYLFLIDIRSIRPWQMFQALSAAITIYLYFEADSHNANRSWLDFLMRIRSLSALFLVMLLAIHGLLVFSPLKAYLPEHLLMVLRAIYGSYFPV
jgi:hypothetical protein